MKIWSYISMFLAGALVMALAALKWFDGDSYDYKTEIKKLKQKRVTGDATMQPIIDMAETTPKNKRVKKPRRTKEQRKADREHRKLDKLNKKD